jgi:formate--tetrahydrofolate ligase
LKPKAVVLVATIRALRHHGGAKAEEYNTPSVERVEKGFANLAKHIENINKFGISPVVAINAFPSDTEEEVTLIQQKCAAMGVQAVLAKGWADGGAGMTELAEVLVKVVEADESDFKPLYDWKSPIREKIETIAKEIYGADKVEFSKKSKLQMQRMEKLGFSDFPICMAKTQKSLSDNEFRYGRPENFDVNVREFEFAAGAGFIIPILGQMMRMPGLPSIPASEGMSIDDNGVISGLS